MPSMIVRKSCFRNPKRWTALKRNAARVDGEHRFALGFGQYPHTGIERAARGACLSLLRFNGCFAHTATPIAVRRRLRFATLCDRGWRQIGTQRESRAAARRSCGDGPAPIADRVE